MILKLVRLLRGLAWGIAAAMTYYEASQVRYTLMHQDTAFQQGVAAELTLCWLVAYLTFALAADRVLELSERNLREQLGAK